MPSPVLIATWSFGLPAVRAAWPGLSSGGSSLDAVEAACRDAEADVANHTVGVGGWPDASGRVTLDAAVMLSPARRGGVCAVGDFPHPISIARRVMEATTHTLLAGAGAESFADVQGFSRQRLLTPDAKKEWEHWREKSDGKPWTPEANYEERRPISEANHDTIGVLALDRHGVLAAGCTTSGLAWKHPGRVGDSPILGHGLYCDPAAGAAVCTGHGELVSGVCGAFLAVEEMRRGRSPIDAGRAVLDRLVVSYTLSSQDQVGVLLMTPTGDWAAVSLRVGFSAAVRSDDRDEMIPSQFVKVGLEF